MKRYGLVGLFLFVTTMLVMVGFAASNELKIGVSAPLTGDIAALGQSTKNAALMAEAEINAAGGIKIGSAKHKVKFIIEDDENKPESTATVFQKLINQDRVLSFIGSQSSKCSNAGAPIAEGAKIPQITPWSTNPNVTKGRQYIFRACFIDPFQGKVVAQYALGNLKAKTAAVLYDVASDYNKGIAEVFRDEYSKAGGKIVGFETYNTKDTDFSAQLTKIKGAGKDMDGAYFTNHYSPDVDRPVAKKFIANYQKKYKMVPDAAAALTYDSAFLLFKAIARARKADPKAIRNAIAATKGFQGITGEITYRGGGDPIKGAVVIRIENGKFVFDSAVNP